MVGHYAAKCRNSGRNNQKQAKKTTTKVAAVEATATAPQQEQEENLGTLLGSWMLLNGQTPAELQAPGLPQTCLRYNSSSMLTGWGHESKVQLDAINSAQSVQHHMFDGVKWCQKPVEPHGRLNLTVSVAEDAYSQLKLHEVKDSRSTPVSALADTGA